MDVGCGANLIYPLLGASEYDWRFVAVDVVPEAIAAAQRNLELNPHLEHLIEIRSSATKLQHSALQAPSYRHTPSVRSPCLASTHSGMRTSWSREGLRRHEKKKELSL